MSKGWFNLNSVKIRLGISLFLVLIYIGVFIAAYDWIGASGTALSLIPLVVIAWFFGLKGGIIGSFLLIILNLVVTHDVVGAEWSTMLSLPGLAGPLVLIIAGIVVGLLSDLKRQSDLELADRKQIELELQRQLRLLETILDTAPSPIFYKDLEGQFVGLNARCADLIFGLPKDQVIGKTMFDFPGIVAHELAVATEEREKNLVEEQKFLTYQIPFKCADGKTHEFFVNKASYQDVEGNTLGIVGVMLDITYREVAEQELRNNIKLLETILDTVPAPIFYKDISGIYRGANSEYAKMLFGLKVEQIIGKSIFDLGEMIPPHMAETIHQRDLNILQQDEAEFYEAPVQLADGTVREYLFNDTAYKNANGETAGIVGVMVDITERKRIEDIERSARQMMETLMEITLSISAELDPDKVLDLILEHIQKVVPYDTASIMLVEGDSISLKRHRGYAQFNVDPGSMRFRLDELETFVTVVASREPVVIPDVSQTSSWQNLETAGHVRSWVGVPIIVHGEVLGVLSLDKTEPDFYQDEIIKPLAIFAVHAGLAIENARLFTEKEHEATHDQLTKLPNRATYSDSLSFSIAVAEQRGMQLGVLFVDLDGFKQINDTLGHDLGDMLLVAVSERMQNCVRQSDTVARLGGDEFTVILERLTNSQGAVVVAQKILDAIAAPYELQGHEICITASVGIALYPLHGEDPQVLLKHADSAMYVAKQSGKGRYAFYLGD
ncbi:MAG: diguanylate cyclase [Anaerolineales bacterium]|nr:diguanylate cyclase [Anaerolineales bacterium]